MSFAERAGDLFSSSDCFPNGCHLPAGALLGHEKFLLHHAGNKSGEERPGLACPLWPACQSCEHLFSRAKSHHLARVKWLSKQPARKFLKR